MGHGPGGTPERDGVRNGDFADDRCRTLAEAIEHHRLDARATEAMCDSGALVCGYVAIPHVADCWLGHDPACDECGTIAQRCSFCTAEARHFLAADVLFSSLVRADGEYGEGRGDATVYFCDDCRDALLSEAVRASGATVRGVELAAYTPNAECQHCDAWS